ncbi:hypothetical protein [Kitasatospora sp. NBC_01266]|uniref:hypothetical protein n=1 Tax=Kitasatospora sp. NBC_01266 TaxID=2903572 RepID=UPI002E333788|nr:hypothetical protein [Kitasatospora sp. NBC_01266]
MSESPATASPATAIPLPRPGDFAVVSMGGEVGRLIRLGQWLNGDGFANYEHAFVLVGDDEVIEAQPGGARQAPLAEYDTHLIRWSSGHIQLTNDQRVEIVAAARGCLRVPYSFLDYAALAAHRVHLPGSSLLKGYVADTRHQICSQLVDQCYQDAGIHLFGDGRWPGYVTPADLYRLIS